MTAIDKRLNFLLALLEDDVFRRWKPHLEVVELPLGKVLYEPGAELDHVYFPTTAIVSMLYVMKNGASAEIAVIGKDGMVGVSLYMGGGSTVSRAVVQSAGTGYRLPSHFLMSEFERGGPVLHLMLRYTQALLTQMSQTAVCNRHHSLHQQFCRWLLLSLDRLPGNELAMTQELISNMNSACAEAASPAPRASCSRTGPSRTTAGRSPSSAASVWKAAPASATRWSRRSANG